MSRRIRPALETDGVAIIVVQTAAWQTAYEGILPADRLATLSDRTSQARRAAMWGQRAGLTDERSSLLIAEVDGVVAGFAASGPPEAPDIDASLCELNVFHLHPDHWGTGLAGELMAATTSWMRDAGYSSAILWTLRDAGRARRFYERGGWVHDGHTQDVLEKPLWHDLEIPQVRYAYEIGTPAATSAARTTSSS